MVKRLALILGICAGGLLLSTCKNPDLIGDELLEDDRINIELTDSQSLEAQPFLRDSVLVYNPELRSSVPGLNNYSIGQMVDPVFGTYSGSVYAQFRPINILPPETEDFQVDSVVLVLEYDTAGFYGPIEETQSVSVHRITEDIDPAVRHYSSETFNTASTALGTKSNFQPNPNQNYFEVDHSVSPPDTLIGPPQLRIPLDPALGEEILNLDSLTLAEGDDFVQAVKGLHVKAETETKSAMGFNFFAEASGLRVYYSEQDTSKLTNLVVSNFSAIVGHQEHDYSGAPVGQFTAGGGTPYDTIAFLQGLSGMDMEVTLPEFPVDRNVLINQATLTFTLGSFPNSDKENYPPVDQFAITSTFDRGSPVYILDALLAFNNNLNRIFGGALEMNTVDGEEVMQYKMNITAHYQDVVEGTSSRKIYITPRPKPSSPRRSILFGPDHARYPMSFEVTYTVENE